MAGLTRAQRVARAAAAAGIQAATMNGLNTPQLPDTNEDVPALSVLERRLQNPFGEPSAPVRLKDETLFPRWFNAANKADAIWRAKEMGWTGITPDMIVDLSQIGTHTLSPDGYVSRGERAQEVLMCMPLRAYQQIQMAKTKENLRKMRDVKGEQARMAEAASDQLGADAAEDMQRHFASGRIGPVGEVRDDLERVERVEPEA